MEGCGVEGWIGWKRLTGRVGGGEVVGRDGG